MHHWTVVYVFAFLAVFVFGLGYWGSTLGLYDVNGEAFNSVASMPDEDYANPRDWTAHYDQSILNTQWALANMQVAKAEAIDYYVNNKTGQKVYVHGQEVGVFGFLGMLMTFSIDGLWPGYNVLFYFIMIISCLLIYILVRSGGN